MSIRNFNLNNPMGLLNVPGTASMPMTYDNTPTLFNLDQGKIQQAINQKAIDDANEIRKQEDQKFKLQNLADTFGMVNARKSGNYGAANTINQRMQQRKLDFEQKRRREAFKQNNPGMVSVLEALEAGIPYQLLVANAQKSGDGGFKNANTLRDEHQKLSGTFIDVRDAYGRILSNAEEQTAASDLSLIFNYMKMLDPGSVVREGEFANAENSAGVPQRIRAQYNKILSGERLDVTTRQDFISTAQKLYDTQLSSQNLLDNNYRELARAYGIDPSRVVLDFQSEIANKEFNYSIQIMSDAELASLNEEDYSPAQRKVIEAELKKRVK